MCTAKDTAESDRESTTPDAAICISRISGFPVDLDFFDKQHRLMMMLLLGALRLEVGGVDDDDLEHRNIASKNIVVPHKKN